MARKQHLVTGHLEGIGAEVFVQFPEVITAMVAGHHGIYALYNGERLYYVGLATDLKNRLKAHLRDRHKKLWDRFSVYITSTDEHIKELESLMLRVIQPEGNRVKGKLKGSDAMNRDLDRRIKDVQDQRRSGILGRIARAPKTGERKTRGASTALIAFYKGFTYKASEVTSKGMVVTLATKESAATSVGYRLVPKGSTWLIDDLVSSGSATSSQSPAAK